MGTEVETLKIEIAKKVIFSNGFSCKYVMDEHGMLDSYVFIKDNLPYHYVSDIDKLQRTLPRGMYMLTEEGQHVFPKYTTEEEILNIENFNNFYHIYMSDNSVIKDKDGNILNTCLYFSNRFLNVWGFKDKTEIELYELIKNNTIFSEFNIHDGKLYSIKFLLNDGDFQKLLDKTKNIHDEEAMFYLRDLFKDKIQNNGMIKIL